MLHRNCPRTAKTLPNTFVIPLSLLYSLFPTRRAFSSKGISALCARDIFYLLTLTLSLTRIYKLLDSRVRSFFSSVFFFALLAHTEEERGEVQRDYKSLVDFPLSSCMFHAPRNSLISISMLPLYICIARDFVPLSRESLSRSNTIPHARSIAA